MHATGQYEKYRMPQGLRTTQINAVEKHFIAGDLRLAISYWLLYLVGAAVFFFAGSWAVDSDSWSIFIVLASFQFAYTVALVIGVKAGYQGPQKWKVVSRTSSVFMITNILVGISTLGFVY